MLLLACAASSAQGAALYQFSGTYRDFYTQEITGPVTFTLGLPASVAATTRFFPGAQLTCSDCESVNFNVDGAYLQVGYRLPTLAEYYFYFTPVSLNQSGIYDSQLLDGTNDGILRTRINGGPGDPEAPEPSTAVLMLAGLGLCAARLRRQS